MYPPQIRRVALELVDSGRSVNSVSRELGISRGAITEWRARADALDERHGCPSPPRSTPQYSGLLGFYLGDGCISANRRTYALRIACDKTLPGIVSDVTRCIEAVHPQRRTYLVSAPGVVVVQSYWKHWPCLFPQHGPGRKHQRTLGMTGWQWAIVEDHLADFLRGLFHSDGCRVNNWATRMVAGEKKRFDYPRWQFTNESAEIMGWCRDALDLVGIPWRQSSRKNLSVSTREGVARLDALIGLKS